MLKYCMNFVIYVVQNDTQSFTLIFAYDRHKTVTKTLLCCDQQDVFNRNLDFIQIVLDVCPHESTQICYTHILADNNANSTYDRSKIIYKILTCKQKPILNMLSVLKINRNDEVAIERS